MKEYNKEIGNLGENIAADYLIKKQHTILERNFLCKIGEIDIISFDKKNNCICFIEVKTRYNRLYGNPCECVTLYKQNIILKVAQYYIIKKHLYNVNFRFDVIEVFLNTKNTSYKINFISDAFRL
jgi:putative endonuclease